MFHFISGLKVVLNLTSVSYVLLNRGHYIEV